MASVYEFIISMRDNFSATAGKAQSSVGNISKNVEKLSTTIQKVGGFVPRVFTQISTSAINAIKGPKKMEASIDGLKAKLDRLNQTKFSTTLKSEFAAVSKEIEKTEKQLKRLEQGITGNGIGAKIKGWRKDFVNQMPGAELMNNPLTLAGAAVGGFWTATQKAMEAGKEKMKLQTLTGSVEIGTALYDGLTKFATDTVFGSEVYDMASQMLANGIKDSDVIPLMKQLGDISMGDANKLGSLSLALAQIQGKGKLAGQELLQMINAGFNPLKVISKETGESMGSLLDKMEKGEIPFEAVRAAMDKATGKGGEFYNMLQNVANTPYGKLEGFKGQLEQIIIQIGEVFLPLASGILDALAWIGDFAGPYLEPLVVAVAGLTTGILAITAAQWMWNLAMSMNPIGWVIAGIVALIGVLVLCWNKFDSFRGAVMGTWEVLKGLGTMIKNYVINRFNELLAGIKGVGSAIVSFLSGDFEGAIQKAQQAGKNIIGAGSAKQALEDGKKAFQSFNAGWEKGVKMKPVSVDNIAKTNQKATATGGGGKSDIFNSLLDGGAGGKGGKGKKGGGIGAGDKVKGDAKSITAGGSKQTHIVVNIEKLQDQTLIQVSNTEQGLNGLGEKVQEILLRAVNSVNQMQTT